MYFAIYADTAGEFRWKLHAKNHKVIADSGEGYTTRHDCLEAVERVREGAGSAKLKLVD